MKWGYASGDWPTAQQLLEYKFPKGQKVEFKKLPYFNIFTVCIKCGTDAASAKWIPSVYEDSYKYRDRLAGQEYIERTCRFCEFKWAEAVLDPIPNFDSDQPLPGLADAMEEAGL